MEKEKQEKIPIPGKRLSEQEAKKIIDKYSGENKEISADLEYFIIKTKDRGSESEKEIFHHILKWEKLPDQELGWIPIQEVIEAIQKYYSEIDPEEKFPVREAIKKLRAENKNE